MDFCTKHDDLYRMVQEIHGNVVDASDPTRPPLMTRVARLEEHEQERVTEKKAWKWAVVGACLSIMTGCITALVLEVMLH